MGIRVLGPLTVDGAAQLSPRERTVLAALVLRAGRPVHPEELADACWADHPPSTWPKQVQASIARLRRVLPPEAIETTGSGYVLRLDGADLDTRRFEDQATRARSLLADGEPERAAAGFSRALALWQGQPFVDLRGWDAGASVIARLEELRRTLEEDHLEARLAIGEHRAVAADAEAAVRAEPLRERRWAALALAQYRCGRQGDALATLRRARRVLDDELGVDPGAALIELEAQILHQDAALAATGAAPVVSPRCPYKGLSGFDVGDEAEFFGRDAEIAACLGRLRESRLLALTGPSGCGKSSLLRAGIAADLARHGAQVMVVTPGATPNRTLEAALSAADPTTVLVVDQVEELFAMGHPVQDVRRFCSTLVTHVAGGGTILLGVRSDAVAGFGADPELSSLVERGLHIVPPLRGEMLRMAIEEPARRAGLRLEHGLVDVLLRDVDDEAGALPLLSHALVETWRRRDGSVLTVEGYQASGGISGAVARSADRLYESLPPDERTLCRSVLLRLVERPPDGPIVRHRVAVSALPGETARERVLDHLVDARLLTREDASVEIAHESLARAWPRLQSWLDEDVVGVRIMRHLVAAAEGWEGLGRPASELYRGARLDAAIEWSAAAGADLTHVEQEFLDASRAARSSELDAERARARHDARQNRRLRWALAAAVGLVVVALAAGTTAVVQTGHANAQRDAAQVARDDAQLEALVSRSLALRQTNRTVAALLAVEAYRRWPDDPRSTSALFGTFTSATGFLGDLWIEDADWVTGELMPGGETAVVALDGAQPVLLDLATGTQDRRFPEVVADGRPGSQLLVDDDGRVAVLSTHGDQGNVAQPPECRPFTGGGGDMTAVMPTGDPDRVPLCPNVVTFDITTGEPLMERLMFPTVIISVALSADAAHLAVIDGTVGAGVVLDPTTGEVLADFPAGRTSALPPAYNGAAAEFASDGMLWVGTGGGELREIDPETGVVVQAIEVPELSVNGAVFPLEGGGLIGIGDRAITRIDTRTEEVLWTVPIESNRRSTCPWPMVWEDGGRIFCGNNHGRIAEHDLATGHPTGRVFESYHGNVGQMEVTADGRDLVAFSQGRPVISRWRLDGSGLVSPLVADGFTPADGYSQDGSRLVVAPRPEGMEWTGEHLTQAIPWDVREGRSVLDRGPGTFFAAVGDRYLAFDEVNETIEVVDPASSESVPLPAIGWGVHWIIEVPGTSVVAVAYVDRLEFVDTLTAERVGAVIDLDDDRVGLAAAAGLTEVLLAFWDGDRRTFSSRTYDARTGEMLAEADTGWSIVSVGGDLAAGTDGNLRVVLFDLATLTPIRELSGTRSEILSVQLSADGGTLLVTTRDGFATVYDTATGLLLGDPVRTSASLFLGDWDDPYWYTPAYLRPDGLAFAAAGEHGTLEWSLDPEVLSEAACQVASRNLTAIEWDSYMSDLGAQRDTCTF